MGSSTQHSLNHEPPVSKPSKSGDNHGSVRRAVSPNFKLDWDLEEEIANRLKIFKPEEILREESGGTVSHIQSLFRKWRVN